MDAAAAGPERRQPATTSQAAVKKIKQEVNTVLYRSWWVVLWLTRQDDATTTTTTTEKKNKQPAANRTEEDDRPAASSSQQQQQEEAAALLGRIFRKLRRRGKKSSQEMTKQRDNDGGGGDDEEAGLPGQRDAAAAAPEVGDDAAEGGAGGGRPRRRRDGGAGETASAADDDGELIGAGSGARARKPEAERWDEARKVLDEIISDRFDGGGGGRERGDAPSSPWKRGLLADLRRLRELLADGDDDDEPPRRKRGQEGNGDDPLLAMLDALKVGAFPFLRHADRLALAATCRAARDEVVEPACERALAEFKARHGVDAGFDGRVEDTSRIEVATTESSTSETTTATRTTASSVMTTTTTTTTETVRRAFPAAHLPARYRLWKAKKTYLYRLPDCPGSTSSDSDDSDRDSDDSDSDDSDEDEEDDDDDIYSRHEEERVIGRLDRCVLSPCGTFLTTVTVDRHWGPSPSARARVWKMAKPQEERQQRRRRVCVQDLEFRCADVFGSHLLVEGDAAVESAGLLHDGSAHDVYGDCGRWVEVWKQDGGTGLWSKRDAFPLPADLSIDLYRSALFRGERLYFPYKDAYTTYERPPVHVLNICTGELRKEVFKLDFGFILHRLYVVDDRWLLAHCHREERSQVCVLDINDEVARRPYTHEEHRSEPYDALTQSVESSSTLYALSYLEDIVKVFNLFENGRFYEDRLRWEECMPRFSILPPNHSGVLTDNKSLVFLQSRDSEDRWDGGCAEEDYAHYNRDLVAYDKKTWEKQYSLDWDPSLGNWAGSGTISEQRQELYITVRMGEAAVAVAFSLQDPRD